MGSVPLPAVKRLGRGVDHPPYLAPRLKKQSYSSNSPMGLGGFSGVTFTFTLRYFLLRYFTSYYFKLLHFASLNLTSIHFTSLHFPNDVKCVDNNARILQKCIKARFLVYECKLTAANVIVSVCCSWVTTTSTELPVGSTRHWSTA
jgi:hypothetical protein